MLFLVIGLKNPCLSSAQFLPFRRLTNPDTHEFRWRERQSKRRTTQEASPGCFEHEWQWAKGQRHLRRTNWNWHNWDSLYAVLSCVISKDQRKMLGANGKGGGDTWWLKHTETLSSHFFEPLRHGGTRKCVPRDMIGSLRKKKEVRLPGAWSCKEFVKKLHLSPPVVSVFLLLSFLCSNCCLLMKCACNFCQPNEIDFS